MNSNKNIAANFIPEYTLAVSADSNSGTINTNGGIYGAGIAINLTATAIFPYAFKNWVGTDNDNINPTTVTMNADKSVTAYFMSLNKGTPETSTTDVSSPSVTIAKFQLNQGQWVQCEIKTNYDVAAHVIDADNNVVKELNRIQNGVFQFQAKKDGLYTFVVYANYAPAPIGAVNGIWLTQMPNSCILTSIVYK
jgi:hypothetical protein